MGGQHGGRHGCPKKCCYIFKVVGGIWWRGCHGGVVSGLGLLSDGKMNSQIDHEIL